MYLDSAYIAKYYLNEPMRKPCVAPFTVMDSLPSHLFLRSGDIVQLISAQEAREQEIWKSDKHMLAAASHFGLTARSASVY